MASSAGSAMIDVVGGALTFAGTLVSHAGGCHDAGTGGIASILGCAAGAAALPFAVRVPAPISTGAGVSGMAGILSASGPDMSGAENGLYDGYENGLELAGGFSVAFARAAFRLRFSSKSAATPTSNAPAKTAIPPISKGLSSELDGGAPVFVSLLFPEFVLFVTGVWLFPVVGDVPAVGDANVTVA